MKKQLIPVVTEEDVLRRRLQKSIERKQKILMDWTARVGMLKLDLDIVRKNYNGRIGRHYQRDDQLDLEIIRHRTLLAYLRAGLTRVQALRKLDGSYYGEGKKAWEHFADEDLPLSSKKPDVSEGELAEIKKLWKSLLFKLHPDLTTDKEEKISRETLMKRINQAYEENDLAVLEDIAANHHEVKKEESNILKLERMLVDIQNSITRLESEFKGLRKSEWYHWKVKIEKAKKENIDIFAELEEQLIVDIARKVDILSELKKRVGI